MQYYKISSVTSNFSNWTLMWPCGPWNHATINHLMNERPTVTDICYKLTLCAIWWTIKITLEFDDSWPRFFTLRAIIVILENSKATGHIFLIQFYTAMLCSMSQTKINICDLDLWSLTLSAKIGGSAQFVFLSDTVTVIVIIIFSGPPGQQPSKHTGRK